MRQSGVPWELVLKPLERLLDWSFERREPGLESFVLGKVGVPGKQGARKITDLAVTCQQRRSKTHPWTQATMPHLGYQRTA